MNGSCEIGTNSELYVWIYLESSAMPVHCGVLELIGGRLCRFEYAPAWLARADAFELSPDLPLRAGKPAYDVQPQLQGIHYQQLKVGRFDYEPSMRNVLSDCGRFLLTEAEACSEIHRMMIVLEKWQEHFAAAGVRQDDIEACSRYVRIGEMAMNSGNYARSRPALRVDQPRRREVFESGGTALLPGPIAPEEN